MNMLERFKYINEQKKIKYNGLRQKENIQATRRSDK
jgi:hypothetical protein